ncbi:hypothetical protein [Mesorhizobium caraganae]|uniref:hypothetical protein n=1 Tax=Mesorhizobium caraganae TaxID=483206 RepID=UPI00333A84D8
MPKLLPVSSSFSRMAVVCMFASVCGPGMFDARPSLRKFVLDREAVGIDPRLRIFCFMTDPKSSKTRQAGVTGSARDRYTPLPRSVFRPSDIS